MPLEELAEEALALKAKGFTVREIGDELHLSDETVTYLLAARPAKGGKSKAAPAGSTPAPALRDLRVGWRTIGVYPGRLRHLAAIMADVVREETGGVPVHTVVGIASNGAVLGAMVAEELGCEFSLYRVSADDKARGALSSNFAGIKGKRVVIVDDVVGTGLTLRGAVENVKGEGGTPILGVVLVNKSDAAEIAGVRLRALVRAVLVG